MMPEEDRATDSMHKTFGIDCACDSRDIIVDKHIHTHTYCSAYWFYVLTLTTILLNHSHGRINYNLQFQSL